MSGGKTFRWLLLSVCCIFIAGGLWPTPVAFLRIRASFDWRTTTLTPVRLHGPAGCLNLTLNYHIGWTGVILGWRLGFIYTIFPNVSVLRQCAYVHLP